MTPSAKATTVPQNVLTFWFIDTPPKSWWGAAPQFDALIRNRFTGVLHQAAQGELYGWRTSPKGRDRKSVV